MRGRLFDSSAIISLSGSGGLDKLLDASTIELAAYELGNAIWKQVSLQRSLTIHEGRTLLNDLRQIVDRMAKIAVNSSTQALEIAVDNRLTYYDASYVQAAIESRTAMVTDDDRLYKVGRKYVEVLKSRDV